MTEEQLTKMAWLNRAYHAEKKVNAIKSLRDSDRERTQRITANYSGNDKGKSDGRKNGIEEALVTLAASDEKYDNALREYSKLRKEIECAIDSLHDDELEAVFTYRYLDYKTIEEIAELMHYDKSTIIRKHKKGLNKVATKCY